MTHARLLGRIVAIAAVALEMICGGAPTAHAHSAANGPVLRTIPVAGAENIVVDEQTDRVFVVGNGVVTMLNARSGGVLATAPVGQRPYSFALDDNSKHIFVVSGSDSRSLAGTLPGVTDIGNASVTMLDATSGAEANAVFVAGRGTAGQNIAVDSRLGRAFVVTTNGLTVLNAHSGALLKVYNTAGYGGNSVTVSDKTGHVFTAGLDSQVHMLDARSGISLKDIAVNALSGNGAGGDAATDERNGHVFIVGTVNGVTSLTTIDAATGDVLHASPVPVAAVASSYRVNVDQQTHRVFVYIWPNPFGNILVYDSVTGAAVGSGGAIGTGAALAIDEQLNRVYVTGQPTGNPGGPANTLSVLDARSGAMLIGVSGVPASGVTADQRTGLLFLTTGNSVTVLSTRIGMPGLVRTTSVGRGASAIAVDARNGHAFIVNTISNSISVIDDHTGTVLRTIQVAVHPVAVSVDETTERVFVANYRAGSVSVLDARSGALLHTVTVGRNPAAIAVDPSTSQVFVINANGYTVSVLDARRGTVLHTVRVGAAPVAVAIDSLTHHAFIANRDSSTIVDPGIWTTQAA